MTQTSENRPLANARIEIERQALRACLLPGKLRHLVEAIDARPEAITAPRTHVLAAMRAEKEGASVHSIRARLAQMCPSAVIELDLIADMDLHAPDQMIEKLTEIARDRRLERVVARAGEALHEGVDRDLVISGMRDELDKAETGSDKASLVDEVAQQAQIEEMLDTDPILSLVLPWGAAREATESIEEGQVIAIIGREGSGKSSLVDSICLLTAQSGVRTMIFVTEMSSVQRRINLAAKESGSFSKIDAANRSLLREDPKLRERVRLGTRDLLDKYGSKSGNPLDAMLLIDDRETYTPAQLARSIEYHARLGVKFFAVDHIHELTWPTSGRIDLVGGDWMHQLMSLAKRYGVTILLVAQCNRRNEDDWSAPTLSSIAEFPSVARKAHHVWAVYRPRVLASKHRATGETTFPPTRVFVQNIYDLAAFRGRQGKSDKEEFELVALPAPGVYGWIVRKGRVGGQTASEVILSFDRHTGRLFDLDSTDWWADVRANRPSVNCEIPF